MICYCACMLAITITMPTISSPICNEQIFCNLIMFLHPLTLPWPTHIKIACLFHSCMQATHGYDAGLEVAVIAFVIKSNCDFGDLRGNTNKMGG